MATTQLAAQLINKYKYVNEKRREMTLNLKSYELINSRYAHSKTDL